MSMYSHFLTIALGQALPSDGPTTTGQALGRLLQRRGLLDEVRGESGASGGAPAALSRELDYDVALIRLARLIGVHSDIASFDRPQTERSRLEQALVDHGIRLDELEACVGKVQ